MDQSLYVKTVVLLVLVDLFWIATGGIYARSMFERIQGQALSIRYLSALLVYVFVAYMLLQTTSYQQAFLWGCAIYGIYDFTNLSVFEHYDWKFAIADMLWGGILFSFVRYLVKRVF